MFGLFTQPNNSYRDGLGADDAAWSIAASDRTVRSIEPVKGFQAVSDRDLTNLTSQLKQRKELSKRWEKWLQLHAVWEDIDASDTKALQNYFSELVKSLTTKRAAIGGKKVALELNRVTQARIEQSVLDARWDADGQIAQMRDRQKSIASSRGWNQ